MKAVVSFNWNFLHLCVVFWFGLVFPPLVTEKLVFVFVFF